MTKGRLEAFSDGVLAIIITIMVLELKVPHGSDFAALKPLLPVFLAYVLSFVYLGIYWNNHHHMLQAAVLFMAAVAYYILARALVVHHGRESAFARALGRDFKGIVSIVIYAAALVIAFRSPWTASSLYVLVAIMWLIPDRRFERTLAASS